MITTLRVFTILVLALGLSSAAVGQDRPYEYGSVFEVTKVDTGDGYFTDYINDLRGAYVKVMERFKEEGLVKSYTVLSTDAEDHDLLLIVEYPNWATFDKQQKFQSIQDEVFGSLDASEEATVERSKLRVIRGTQLYQELELKK